MQPAGHPRDGAHGHGLRDKATRPHRCPPKLQRACPAVDEVTGLQMIEIDLTDRVWTIPPTRMKATREHRVPLCCVDAPWRFSTRRKLVVTK